DAAIEATSQQSIAATKAATEAAIEAPPAIAEDGTYNSRDDVALYIHTYGKLPSNFITKKEAKKLGWTGGNVEDYAPGKSIGGDYLGNYEGLLPEDKSYHECDIDTLGKSSRGARRIIYSDDGYIYYTEDHYESFELLYEP
ncbi:MAG: ribonuclease, partial [Lachnospiraceae bacterium]|nr:ribonuclease [Lachnospiraceae bacterium]